jgi:hypothetical protein
MLLLCFAALAQQLAVESCIPDDNDQTARITSPRIDQNGKKCAIVKIETTLLLQDFTFDAGMVGIAHTEQKTGEIWVYLPPGAQRITINHKYLGTRRNYEFGEALEEATVYIMKLKSGIARTVIEESPQHQYLEVACAIDGAAISIDDAEPEPFINGKFSKLLSYGKHQYTIEAPLHHTLHGITEITAKKQSPLAATLQPAFGKIVVNTQPEQGADVFVDGVKRGQSPLTIDKIHSGEHTVRVMKTLYLPADEKTTVSDGQTATLNITMKPNFADLTFNADGDIYINDAYKAAGTWRGRLASGMYKVEVRKSAHRPSLTTVEAKANETRTVTLEAPVPVYGLLNITANVTAQIYVDDKPIGETTPYLINQVLVGSHRVELRADGYQPYKQTVEVQEGKMATLQGTLQKAPTTRYGSLNINANPVRFIITAEGVYLNEKTWGGTAAIGCRLNRYMALVAGSGYVSYSSENVSGTAVPVFANLRINVLRTMLTPYVAVAGGACFDTYTNIDNYIDNGYTFSEKKERKATYVYYNASAGLALRIHPVQLHAGTSYNNIVNAFTVNAGLTIIF